MPIVQWTMCGQSLTQADGLNACVDGSKKVHSLFCPVLPSAPHLSRTYGISTVNKLLQSFGAMYLLWRTLYGSVVYV